MDPFDALVVDAPNLTPSMVTMVFPTPSDPSGILSDVEIVELNSTMIAYMDKFLPLLFYQIHPSNPKMGCWDPEVKDLCPIAIDNIKRFDGILAFQLEKNDQMIKAHCGQLEKVRIHNIKLLRAVESTMEMENENQEDDASSENPETSEMEDKDEEDGISRERFESVLRISD